MSRKFLGQPIATADIATIPGIYQKVIFNDNYSLLATRAKIILYNDPAFSTIQMKIYGDRAGSPGKLLFTSSSLTKAQVLTTSDHAFKEIYFTFSTKPTFYSASTYHFALYINDYTGDNTTHIAWANAWPDPIYKTNLTLSIVKSGGYPLDMHLIGSELP